MKQTEILEIRAHRDKLKQLGEHLNQFYENYKLVGQGIEITIYRNPHLESDYLIAISRTTSEPERESVIANRLVDALKEFGIVNHNIWLEI